MLLVLSLTIACRHGEGHGTVQGQLHIPSCELEEESFDLRIDFFTATYFEDTLTIRLQHAGAEQALSDGVLIQIRDVEAVSENLGETVEIEIEPSLETFAENGPEPDAGSDTGVPTTTRDSPAQATLYLNETCPDNRLGFAHGDGTLSFESIYIPDKESRIKGTFDLRFVDPRTWESPEESGEWAEIHGEFDFNYKESTPEQDFI
jgi:hypothetical protein